MSAATSDVVVVGGGIVGAASAWALAREKLRVTLVEASVIGGGATAAGMGHVVVMDDSPAQWELTRYSQQLWYELVDRLPQGSECSKCGTIWVAADGQQMQLVQEKCRNYQQHGLDAEILDAKALTEAEPHLRGGLAGGLRVPGDFVLFPPPVACWMAEQARQLGAEVLVGLPAVALDDGLVRLADGRRLSAGGIINATGTAAGQLLPGVALQARKGHLVITQPHPGLVRHQLIELGYLTSVQQTSGCAVAFNVQPRITGQLLIGSSRQYGDESRAVDARVLAQMIGRVLQYMPALAHTSALRTWTGLRAATEDKLPLIGPAPGWEKIYLATGHEGLGITTCLATASLLVDHLLQRQPAIPWEPYLPARATEGNCDG